MSDDDKLTPTQERIIASFQRRGAPLDDSDPDPSVHLRTLARTAYYDALKAKQEAVEAIAALKAARQRLHLTQKQVAAILDISHREYTNIEIGERPATLDLLRKLKEWEG